MDDERVSLECTLECVILWLKYPVHAYSLSQLSLHAVTVENWSK